MAAAEVGGAEGGGATLEAAYRYLLELPIADPRALLRCYASIPEPEQRALFGEALLARGLSAAELAAGMRRFGPASGAVRLAADGVRGDALARQLADAPEPQWLVPGYVPGVGLTLLASRPKRGKTLLAEHLAVEVARGGQWLGFPLAPGPAVIIQADQGWRSTARRLATWGVEGLPLTVLARRGLRLAAVEGLAGDLASLAPRLVVLDAAAVLLDLTSETDNTAVARELAALTALAERLNAAILLIHHNRKAESGAEALVSVRGGSAWLGGPDVILELLPTPDGRLQLRSTPRDGAAPAPLTLELDAERLIWRVVGRDEQTDLLGRWEAPLLAAIAELGEAATTTELARQLDVDRKTAERRLHDLQAQGRVRLQDAEVGARGRPAPIWRLDEGGIMGMAPHP